MSDYRIKLWFGYMLVAVVAVLAGLVAWGKVDEKTSFGLRELILILGMLASMWAQWAFSGTREKKNATSLPSNSVDDAIQTHSEPPPSARGENRKSPPPSLPA